MSESSRIMVIKLDESLSSSRLMRFRNSVTSTTRAPISSSSNDVCLRSDLLSHRRAKRYVRVFRECGIGGGTFPVRGVSHLRLRGARKRHGPCLHHLKGERLVLQSQAAAPPGGARWYV